MSVSGVNLYSRTISRYNTKKCASEILRVLKLIVNDGDAFRVECDTDDFSSAATTGKWKIVICKASPSYPCFLNSCNTAYAAVERAMLILLIEELSQHDPKNHLLKNNFTDINSLYSYKYTI